MTPILIRAELTDEALNPRFAVVMIDGIRTAISRALIVTPDDPVSPAPRSPRKEAHMSDRKGDPPTEEFGK